MDEKTVFGILVVLLCISASAQESLVVEQKRAEVCPCETATYSVIVSNDLSASRVFSLDASADPDIWASLKPDKIVVGGNSQESLKLYARSLCDTAPGTYKVYAGISCFSIAGEGACEEVTRTEELELVVRDCPRIVEPVPRPAEPAPTPVQPPAGGVETGPSAPTGGVVESENVRFDLYLAIIVIILVVIAVLLILIIQRYRK
jgi:hypothetical protein